MFFYICNVSAVKCSLGNPILLFYMHSLLYTQDKNRGDNRTQWNCIGSSVCYIFIPYCSNTKLTKWLWYYYYKRNT